MQLRSAKNGTVTIGVEIARGGEGTIHTVEGNASLVAKLYLREPDQTKIAKISAMAAIATDSLKQVAAWPLDVVSDSKGRVRGFVMPRVQSRADVHELYSPKSRAVSFPETDFRFILHVATNIARAYGTIHNNGCVIGDINHAHMLVGRDGRVVLIDTDSFQVSARGTLFTCDVGTDLFTPPELQGQPFRGLVRTSNHDLFGLGVILFLLLFLGRHPYAGSWKGQGEMPLERAIRENRFAYGASAAHLNYVRPPNTLPLSIFGPQVAALFERAFAADRSAARPLATEWVEQLAALQKTLKVCQKSHAHYYPDFLSVCPWCEFEAQTGVRLFGQKLDLKWTGTVDITQLWAGITQVPQPSVDPPLPSDRPWIVPSGAETPNRLLKVGRQAGSLSFLVAGLTACSNLAPDSGGILLGLAGAVGAYFAWPRASAEKRAETERRVAAAKQQYEQLRGRWIREASCKIFESLKQTLAATKREYDDIPNERLRRLAALKSEQKAFQMRRHLDRFRIDRTQISGIGPGRATILAGFGIETAGDVVEHRVRAIQGFGPKLTGELMAWRQAQEAKFRFNPSEPIDPGEVARVEGEIAVRRNNCLQALQGGAAQLVRLSNEIQSARQRLMPAIQRAWDEYKLGELQRQAL